MARTPYATEVHDTAQKSGRSPSSGQPSFIVIHHAATESFGGVVAMELGTKQVSSTVVIKDGQVASMFDESYRAWSLSSQYWDSVSLSSETCNSGGAAEGWPISEASYRTLARVVADWCNRYGIPCNRERVMGHREVYTRYGASYATACPGGINLDRVVDMANAYLAGTASEGGTPLEKEIPMPALIRHPNGSIGFLSDAGELDAIGTLNEVESLKSTGIVPTWIEQPANVWDTLTARTARLRAVRAGAPVDVASLAAQIAPLLVGPILSAINDDPDSPDLTVAQVEAAARRAVVSVLGGVK